MSIELGRNPEPLTVSLTAGDPFACELLLDGGGNWDPSTLCTLTVGDQTWTATVHGNALRFDATPAQVTAALAASTRSAGLHLDGVTIAKGVAVAY